MPTVRQSNDKEFTLRNRHVTPYRNTHRKNRSPRSTYLVMCTRLMIVRFLVQTEKLKKAASEF